MLSSQQLERCFHELVDLKNEIIAQLRLSEMSSRPVELDQSLVGRVSRGDAILQQQMSKASEDRDRTRLGKVIKALNKIDKNDYGYCIKCEEDIAYSRLLIMPESEYCVHCQSDLI